MSSRNKSSTYQPTVTKFQSCNFVNFDNVNNETMNNQKGLYSNHLITNES